MICCTHFNPTRRLSISPKIKALALLFPIMCGRSPNTENCYHILFFSMMKKTVSNAVQGRIMSHFWIISYLTNSNPSCFDVYNTKKPLFADFNFSNFFHRVDFHFSLQKSNWLWWHIYCRNQTIIKQNGFKWRTLEVSLIKNKLAKVYYCFF